MPPELSVSRLSPRAVLTVLALGLLVLGGGAARAQGSTADAAIMTEHAYRYAYGGRIIVEGRIGGVGPVDLIFDTASSASAVFESTAAALGLDLTDAAQATVLTASGQDDRPIARVGDLTVGPRVLADLETVVLPNWSDAGGPAAVLGLDFLTRYFVLVDVGRRVIQLYDERPARLPGRWRGTDLIEIPVGQVRPSLYMVRGRILNERFRFLLDSGANATIVNWAAAGTFGLTPDSFGIIETELTDALDLTAPIVAFQAPRLTIARTRFRDSIIAVGDLEVFSVLAEAGDPVGLVGLDVLTEQSFALDFKAERLLLRRR